MSVMGQNPSTYQIGVVPLLTALTASEWDACAGPDNPFVSYAFLSSLEEAGCVGERAGWVPLHIVVRNSSGLLVGVAPCYLKSHSQGEYVFDHGWAQAYENAGGSYYPKLQVSVPFTPATGPRLLARNNDPSIKQALIGGLQALCDEVKASSIHLTFLPEIDWKALGEQGFLLRQDEQFHWINNGYVHYDDFLATLQSRKRKALRKERAAALGNGITIRRVTGNTIREADWDAFFEFYMDTGARKWGRPYLNRRFFSLIGERMADKILLVMADRAGRPIAGAINFIGSDALYGRNWGAIEDHPFLHFEVCYHQAIDFAIERGLTRVEAGAQGEHKLARGYAPATTYSAHWIADPALRRGVSDYLDHERAHMQRVHQELADHTPFRKIIPVQDTQESE